METQLIKTQADYAAALNEIDALMSAERGTVQGRRLQVLAKLVQEYEAKYFPIDLPKPIDEK